MNICLQIIGHKELKTVGSIKDAVLAWNSFRDDNAFGASQMRGNCGEVTEQGAVIARVHYNGRVEEVNS